MNPYKPWDFCKDTDCKSYRYPGLEEERILFFCEKCKAYKMHQYLREHGQIVEEGSPCITKIAVLTEENDIQRASIQELSRRVSEGQLTYEQQYLLDLVGQMAEGYRPRFDLLPDGLQEIIRAYDKTLKKEEAHEHS